MKIAATTLGETAGDLLAQTLRISYGVSTLLPLGILAVTLTAQLAAKRYHPALSGPSSPPRAPPGPRCPTTWTAP